MALISTTKIFLKDQSPFTKKVTYSGGKFHSELPPKLSDQMNLEGEDRSVHGDTEDEVNKLFDNRLKEWERASTKKEKVILFTAKFQGILLKKQHWAKGKYDIMTQFRCKHLPEDKFEFRCSDIHWNDSDELGLTLKWAIYEKTTVLGRVRYTFQDGRPFGESIRDKEDATEILWTKEREKFFLDMDLAFAQMIAKVHKALGELTPEKLMTLADSGAKLLQ